MKKEKPFYELYCETKKRKRTRKPKKVNLTEADKKHSVGMIKTELQDAIIMLQLFAGDLEGGILIDLEIDLKNALNTVKFLRRNL